LANSKRNRFC